jgi:hypothetical protein
MAEKLFAPLCLILGVVLLIAMAFEGGLEFSVPSTPKSVSAPSVIPPITPSTGSNEEIRAIQTRVSNLERELEVLQGRVNGNGYRINALENRNDSLQ